MILQSASKTFAMPWLDGRTVKRNADIKSRIRAAGRQARLAPTLDEQSRVQQTIRDLETTKRKQRQEIFAAEDQIMEKRDQLIEALHRRMSQKTSRTRLFMIRWEVV